MVGNTDVHPEGTWVPGGGIEISCICFSNRQRFIKVVYEKKLDNVKEI